LRYSILLVIGRAAGGSRENLAPPAQAAKTAWLASKMR
jgi:hypothetical protein